jgi:hypothetical protein
MNNFGPCYPANYQTSNCCFTWLTTTVPFSFSCINHTHLKIRTYILPLDLFYKLYFTPIHVLFPSTTFFTVSKFSEPRPPWVTFPLPHSATFRPTTPILFHFPYTEAFFTRDLQLYPEVESSTCIRKFGTYL